MLILLVFLILVVLIFGASALLSALIGVVAWVIGVIAVLATAIWGASTYHVDAGVVILGVIFGPILGLFVFAFAGFHIGNRKLPHHQRKTFAEFWKEIAESNS